MPQTKEMLLGDIFHVPPPWKLKGTIYLFAFWTTKAQAEDLPSLSYSPLEATSGYGSAKNGRPLGGLSMVQVIRYTQSPVGPYDEMILVPGFHSYFVESDGKGGWKKAPRITRIYVSQKYTCWNGRKSK